ncbi:bifunctional glycosyltransferase/CDP-glycerol:glycerophosphate glycerophosphotransferase [Kitasatospora aureofaciens]|nr:bifunctional glycosyltransferase family 2 protein/CDP-glycerol:glycerophosphate glycerophosphotransferase [Streptomyces sp. SID5914]MZG15979.1 glycosyltransferase [Streptomyces sp. SID5914]BET52785.1 bifunctional glycosyltransferase/CDP-glycerol:glycerophosphate glycerophosphotransferase [Kitasatospora aureofaciens]
MDLRISIVVPVHGVEALLPECLDSLLAQGGAELELIAVDDASPDGCAAILDAYAERDERLRVVHLAENRGLGGARKAGLERATGDYVWFVDGDDRLMDGAVEAVAQRLAQVRPDVLVTDFVRGYPDGRVEPNTWRRQIADPPPPEVFTLADRPQLLSMIMSVWNKVVRREYLLTLGVEFGDGYYEDISVTYPLLLAAERISYLDRPCYYYRREREGAITHSSSPKHLDAFGQYDRIFDFIDARAGGTPPGLRRRVFDRTVLHGVTVYRTPGLVPGGLRREFFDRLTGHFRDHRPDDYSFPGGVRGLQYRCVARGARGAFHRMDDVNRLRRLPRGAAARGRRAVRGLLGLARRGVYRAFLRLPMNENLAVYAAYWYRGYACSPAAVYEKARELAPSVRGVWVVADKAAGAALPDGVDCVVANTLPYLRVMATAKYLVNNVNFPHTMTKRPGSVHVQTQHGTPLKHMGLDLKGRPSAGDMDFERLLEHVGRWDYLVTPNPHTTTAFTGAYPGRYEVLETGYPRNDRLAAATAQDRETARAALGVREGSQVLLWAPTHRDGATPSRRSEELTELARELGDAYTLLVRHHYLEAGAEIPPVDRGARILDVSGHPSVEELCLAADLLVTDYSSLMFDFAVLDDRPIALYVPDWERYRRERGVYFDLLAAPPGVVATTVPELAHAISSGRTGEAEATRLRQAFRERFCPHDDGRASERVVRRVFPVA